MNRIWSNCDSLGFPFLPGWVVGNRHVGVAGAAFASRRSPSRVRSLASAFAAALTWWAQPPTLRRGGAPGPARLLGWARHLLPLPRAQSGREARGAPSSCKLQKGTRGAGSFLAIGCRPWGPWASGICWEGELGGLGVLKRKHTAGLAGQRDRRPRFPRGESANSF